MNLFECKIINQIARQLLVTTTTTAACHSHNSQNICKHLLSTIITVKNKSTFCSFSLIQKSKSLTTTTEITSLYGPSSSSSPSSLSILKLRNASSIAINTIVIPSSSSTSSSTTTTRATPTPTSIKTTKKNLIGKQETKAQITTATSGTTRSSSLIGQEINSNESATLIQTNISNDNLKQKNYDHQHYESPHYQQQQQHIINKRNKNNLNKILNDKNLLEFDEIPAAKGLPIFGTHLDFIAAGSAQQLHKYIHKRHVQLGPIFREKLGSSQDAVFVSSPNLIRTVFNYEGQYPTHPLPESWNIYNKKHNCRRGLFFMNGPEWLQNRRIMNKFLLNGNCNWINQHIQKSTNNLIEMWKKSCRSNKKSSSSFVELNNLEAQLYRWSIDVLTSIMFGKSLSDSASKELLKEVEIFSKNVHKIFESSSSLMSFPPKLAELLKLKIWTDFETNVTDVLDMGNNIIDKCINEFGYGNGLLAKMIECEISIEDVRRIFVDLIIAAGDTTAHSTQWAFYLLTKSEKIQETARKELNSLKLNEESQYIKGLIKETLRLYPVAPFIGRFLACDANIGNYRVNKNTLVLLSLYTSGRDENSFPDALNVSPERWFRNSNGELMNVLHPTASIPFAMGIRSCIGKKIALNQMSSLLSQLIQTFEISCLNKSEVDVILRMVAVPNQQIRLVVREI